jgi:HTH-type transcriptional regulator / antitoxin HigA
MIVAIGRSELVNVKTNPHRISDDYVALLNAFPPRPIRNDEQHRRAVEVVNGLLDRPELTSDEEDYLDVLGLLIADYEDSIYVHPEFTPVDRLRRLMGEHALTQAELARRAGVAVTSLSDILNDKRRISPKVRAKFAECFGVSANFFA